MEAHTTQLFAALYHGQSRPGPVSFKQEDINSIHQDILTIETICSDEKSGPRDAVAESVRDIYRLGMKECIAHAHAAFAALAAARKGVGKEEGDDDAFISHARAIYQLVSGCDIAHRHIVFMERLYDSPQDAQPWE
jgi:hypothetical protein